MSAIELKFRSTGAAPKPTARSPQSQSQTLLEILGGTDLFHAPDQTATYADIEIRGHRETWRVGSPGFRNWLIESYFRRTAGATNESAFQQALRTAEAKAKYSGREDQVYVRVGRDNGAIYLDLADPDWRAIKIDAGGWSVESRPSIRFVRPKGMLPLPLPVPGGSIRRINAEKLRRTSAKRGWSLTPISADKADLPSSPSSVSTAAATCADVSGAVIRNQQTAKANDDPDANDDKFAGFSGRQHKTPVLSDIDAAHEELRVRTVRRVHMRANLGSESAPPKAVRITKHDRQPSTARKSSQATQLPWQGLALNRAGAIVPRIRSCVPPDKLCSAHPIRQVDQCTRLGEFQVLA